MALVVTCLASAAMASPALAASAPVAPVDIPLHGLGTVLPETPVLRTGVPIPVPGAPSGFTRRAEGGLPPLLVPQLPLTTGTPETTISAELPDVEGDRPTGRALLAAPASDVHALTPGAVAGLPLTLPGAETLGLPGLALPSAGVLPPALTGTVESSMGLDSPAAGR
ncbi:hypothetical protein C6N75_23550 [Streptomyces solincola]|uniref:Secreted protein n=1 Tax=Streptomyces solincola TaxID=2100817 RepID=A0A2S9PR04_9ACTN|nr:hypothetical protein [Streptomyces solincola]PRH76831.1 hypothetical protein C6N75_23550 [Streptomyces solincola]